MGSAGGMSTHSFKHGRERCGEGRLEVRADPLLLILVGKCPTEEGVEFVELVVAVDFDVPNQ